MARTKNGATSVENMMRNVEYLEDFFRPYFMNFLYILVSARSTPSTALHAASNPRSTLHCGHAPHVLTRTSTGLFLKIRGCGGPAVGFDPRHMHLSLERRTWAVALGQCNLKGKNVLLYTHLKKEKETRSL